MPRFVILEHDHPELHWDLMLQLDDKLRTWRLPAPPTGRPETALEIGAHRSAYLDYEGPVSGNRGNVKRWDAGTYETIDAQTSMEWTIELRGIRWQGTATMAHEHGQTWSIGFNATEH